MKLIEKYNIKRPSHEPVRPTLTVVSAKGVKRVLEDMKGFKTLYMDPIGYLTKGYGFFLAFDAEPKHADMRKMVRVLIGTRRNACFHFICLVNFSFPISLTLIG